MARLFISYARGDADVAKQLAAALEELGHETWWDRRLSGGAEFSREIEQELESSDRVIVLWSARAKESPWVRDEAAVARDAGKLVPASIDGSVPPLGFRQFHTLDLKGWASKPGRLPDDLLAAIEPDAKSRSGAAQDKVRSRQRIQFCRTRDGVNLAYSQVGNGPPLVKVANWLNHLEHEWENPLWSHWIDELSRKHSLLRYDERGNGMSDWDVPALSFDQLVDDLETVVNSAGLDRFDLFAISQGSPVAIAFAVRNPERVRRMILINGFAAGWRYSRDPEAIERWEAMSSLAKTGWGKDTPAFRQLFTSLFFPDATPEQARWWNELQLHSASAANAERFVQLFGEINVGPLLRQVTVPTLVIHCRGDQLIPFEAGRQMASRIPTAQFIALEGRNHLPLEQDESWPKMRKEIDDFLGAV